jgi:muramoyltetrapeptide carboxypeptidase
MMQLTAIQPGDIIDIVAPSSACRVQELKAGVKVLTQMGYRPRVPKNLFGRSVLFSNIDRQRLSQFRRAVYAEDSRMIWCVRGGYGAIRLLPEIEKWRRPRLSKIFLGYSDITTLHVFLNQQWKWPTLHGPMIGRLGRGLKAGESRELFGLLGGERFEQEFLGLQPMNSAARAARVIRAPVLGGNMAVLQSGVGTFSGLNPRGAILFFEDLSEKPHRIDRMLTQFSQAGWFDHCKAVVLGDFLLEPMKDRRHIWTDVFHRFARETKLPVLRGLPVGHDPKRNRVLPLGTRAELRLGARSSLTVDSGIRAR